MGRDRHRGGVVFDIAGDWKAMVFKAGVRVEMVIKGGWRFMAAWRKDKKDAGRPRQEKG